MNKKNAHSLKSKILQPPEKPHNISAKTLHSWSKKLIGLAGQREIYPVYFETRFGIHTFGMKVSVDVLILDNANRVVKIRKNLKPGKVFFWNPKYSKVIESPSGFIKVKISDKISIL